MNKLLTRQKNTVDVVSKTKELGSLYESVCERQRQSSVRNAALLKDVERVQSLLAGRQQCHNQLNALKSRYQQYVAAVYPQWLSKCKGHHGNEDNNKAPPKVTAASVHVETTSTTVTVTAAPATTSSESVIPTQMESRPTQALPRQPDPLTPKPTQSLPWQPDPLTPKPTQALPRQPDSLTPSPADRSLDSSLSTYSFSEGDSPENVESTVNQPVIEQAGTASSHTLDEPAMKPMQADMTLKHTLSKPIIEQAGVTSNHTLDEPAIEYTPSGTASNHTLDEPAIEYTPSGTASNHTLDEPTSESSHAGTASNHTLEEPAIKPTHACTASNHSLDEPASESSHAGTASNHTLDEPTSESSHAGTASNHTLDEPASESSPARTLSQHHSPINSPLSPPPTPTRVSSLPPTIPSPPHSPPQRPPPTPTRTSSLPPTTPSPPHSPPQRPDIVRVVTNLLRTLNNHLRVEGEATVMELYTKPEDSDKMKRKISNSNVLSSNIIKCADEGMDCSTWDVSVMSVVLLTQLSLLTATHGSLVPDNLLSEEAPLISHPINLRSPWSQVWGSLLEHAQFLYNTGRALDELAAIFTPALFTSPSEKACLQLIALFNLDIESSHEKSDKSHDVSYGVSDEEFDESHTCSLPGIDAEFPSGAQHDVLLDYSALGGRRGDLSEHSSLLSEGSAVLLLEKKLVMDSFSPTLAPGAQQPLHSTSSDDSSIATPPAYVPTALESNVPNMPSLMSNNSSLRRRLGFYDDSDSELDEASELLTSRKQATADNDFDF
ncbi:mucin-2-like isoform X2 [Halichondria panicea]|uniref:mucin-2-like isoform X2 n=1 Tax=Halichondria panicea TaxID=6063 RepID=UPI00312BA079